MPAAPQGVRPSGRSRLEHRRLAVAQGDQLSRGGRAAGRRRRGGGAAPAPADRTPHNNFAPMGVLAAFADLVLSNVLKIIESSALSQQRCVCGAGGGGWCVPAGVGAGGRRGCQAGGGCALHHHTVRTRQHFLLSRTALRRSRLTICVCFEHANTPSSCPKRLCPEGQL